MIHVCYALYDKNRKYSKLTGTSICSLFENTKAWVTIHLLHDKTLTEENRRRFAKLARRYANHIVFYNMDELFDMDAIVQKYVGTAREKGFSLQYSFASLYRLLLVHFLPKDIHRLIYLDSDIIVNCDIQDLWKEEIGENGLAAVPEMKIFHWEKANETKAICNDGFVKFERYFNAGVLLLDMDAYRQHPTLLEDGLSFLVEHPTYSCFDQDILNYVFSEHCRLLDVRYNTFVETERRRGGKAASAIYHYAAHNYSMWGSTDDFTQLLSHYYQLSPWYDDTQFAVACQSNLRLGIRLCTDLIRGIQGRRVVICGHKDILPIVQQNLVIFPDALFLNIFSQDNNFSVAKILRDMRQLRNEKPTCFVFMDMLFQQWSHYLVEGGFQPDRDFINGTPLMLALKGDAIPASPGLLDTL